LGVFRTKVWGLGSRGWGLEKRVWGSGFRVFQGQAPGVFVFIVSSLYIDQTRVSRFEWSGSGVQESRVQGLGFEAHHLQATVLGGGPSSVLHRTPRPRRPTKDGMTLHALSLKPQSDYQGAPARPDGGRSRKCSCVGSCAPCNKWVRPNCSPRQSLDPKTHKP